MEPKKPPTKFKCPLGWRKIFEISHPRARPGYKWENGRETKQQKIPRPPNVWPEVWKHLNKEARQKAIDKWASEADERSKGREDRGIGISESFVRDLDVPRYRKAFESLGKTDPEVPMVTIIRSAGGNPSSSLFSHFADEAFGSAYAPAEPEGSEAAFAKACQFGMQHWRCPSGSCVCGPLVSAKGVCQDSGERSLKMTKVFIGRKICHAAFQAPIR